MPGSAPIVVLDGVSVRAGTTPILRDIDLEIPPGGALGIFGANGSGKTTLLRLIATLVPPTSGTGAVLGADLRGSDRYSVRHRIGLIGHIPALYPELTLRENLVFVAKITDSTERVEDVLAAVGLTEAADRVVVACSHGMQRRAEFARELLRRPDVLLLDEPHTALDASAVDLVSYVVADVVLRGGVAVVAAHDRERVDVLVDTTAELKEGTIT